jgi:allantoinase
VPTYLRAARAITPEGERAVTVVMDGPLITHVLPFGSAVPGEAVTLGDELVLLPGLVDSHVHVNEPGRTEWEGFTTATLAAAAGGVTTFADMPLNAIPPTVDVASLELKRKSAEGQLSVDVAFWGGAIPGNADDLLPLHEAGVVGFKCFLLPSGVDEFPPLDQEGLTLAMRTIASFGGLLIAHCEDEDVIESAPHAHGRAYADFVASRPDLAEARAVERLIATTRATGCRTHIVHVSSASVLPLVRAAKDEGLPLTAETCPHYLTMEAERIPDGATQYKCCPPIRSRENRELLWEALLDGTLDMIVSDHSPCVVEKKRLESGDFGEAWGGIASVQLGLPAVWSQARARGIPLAKVVHWMAEAPAALIGLTDRAAIAPGHKADFVVFDPDSAFTVDRLKLRHRNPLSPYHGKALTGIVRRTWLDGAPIVEGEVRGGMVKP